MKINSFKQFKLLKKNLELFSLLITICIIIFIFVGYYFIAINNSVSIKDIINTIFVGIITIVGIFLSILASLSIIKWQEKKDAENAYFYIANNIINELDIHAQWMVEIKGKMDQNNPLISEQLDKDTSKQSNNDIFKKMTKILLLSGILNVSLSDKYYICLLNSGIFSKIHEYELNDKIQKTYQNIDIMKFKLSVSANFANYMSMYIQSTDPILHAIAESQKDMANKNYENAEKMIDKNIKGVNEGIDKIIEVGEKYGHKFTRNKT